MNFPAHPFWDFSLWFYRRPGVADACLFLQDRYGFDVNLLLYAVWVAHSGHGALNSGQIAAAMRRVSDWQAQVVEPLRAIRRACRREPLGIPEFLLDVYQPHIEAAELEAEHVEQLILAELAATLPPADSSRPCAEDAAASLDAYVGALQLEREPPLEVNLKLLVRSASEPLTAEP